MRIDCQVGNPFVQDRISQLPQEDEQCISEMASSHTQYMANAYNKFNYKRSQVPQGNNLSIAEMANAYTKFIDDVKQKANKLLLED